MNDLREALHGHKWREDDVVICMFKNHDAIYVVV